MKAELKRVVEEVKAWGKLITKFYANTKLGINQIYCW